MSLPRLPRALKWTLIVFGAFLLGFALALALVRDETLRPEVVRVLEGKPSVPPEQNMYFALLGLPASLELDPAKVGREIAAAHKASVNSKGFWAEFNPRDFLGPAPMPSDSTTRNRLCASDCLRTLRANRAIYEAEQKAFAPYLERYRALRSYSQFEETMVPAPSAFIPHFSKLVHMSELINARIAIDMMSPDTDVRGRAITELREELATWKKIAEGRNMLVTSVMANSVIKNKYRLASELLSEDSTHAIKYAELFAAIAVPPSKEQRSMARALESELRFVAVGMSAGKPPNVSTEVADESLDPMTDLSGWRRVFHKGNATINQWHETADAMDRFYLRDGPITTADENELRLSFEKFSTTRPATWFYNPAGKVLLSISLPSYQTYLQRRQDVAGYARLIELQRRIAADRISRDKIEAFVRSAPPELRDPYTHEPMRYDAATNTLSFTGRALRDDKPETFVVQLAGQPG